MSGLLAVNCCILALILGFFAQWNMRIDLKLYLYLKAEYFDKIVSGEKKEVFRLYNRYWKEKLKNKNYESIILYNGKRTWWLSCYIFTCIITTDDALCILDTAPILSKWKGKFLEDVILYYRIKP